MRNLWVAAIMVLGALALMSLPAWAQMGPMPDWGPWMRGGTGSSSGSDVQLQKQTGRPENPPPPRVPTTTGTPRMERTTGAAMEHPTAAAPFYKERTFLVLVGGAIAGAGFFASRITRSQVRGRYAPMSFVTEAVLVVDLVESTHLATHYSDGLASRPGPP
jgi:hypothetical protein